MSLLYTYPISRQKLIYAKITLISGIMLLFHMVSSAFQHLAIYLISLPLDFVSYSLDNVARIASFSKNTEMFLSFIGKKGFVSGMIPSGRMPTGWLPWNVQNLTAQIIAVAQMNGKEKQPAVLS